MTQLTLGQRLAQQQADEQARTVQAEQNAARAKSEEALKEFKLVHQFFEDAKQYFETAILNQTPTAKLRLQIGSDGKLDKRNTHEDVYRALAGWNQRGSSIPSLQGDGKYASLWTAFKEWAASNGLQAKLEYAWSGDGVHSWWNLRVKPAASSKAPLASAAALCNDVRASHAYSLHVLGAVLHGYKDALNRLQAFAGHPDAQEHLTKFKGLIETVDALHSQIVGD